jgi:hypothetical protein
MADYSIEVAIPNQGPAGPQGPPGEFGELEAPQDGIIYGRKDAEWVDMTAPANLQVRRGTAAEVAAVTPLEGEPVWETDTKKLRVGDGITAAGIIVGLQNLGQIFKLKITDQSTSGGTTDLFNDNDLFFETEANSFYEVDIGILGFNNVSELIRAKILGNNAQVFGLFKNPDGSLNQGINTITETNTIMNTNSLQDESVSFYFHKFFVIGDEEAGQVTFQFGSETSNAGDISTIKAGSYLRATKLTIQ